MATGPAPAAAERLARAKRRHLSERRSKLAQMPVRTLTRAALAALILHSSACRDKAAAPSPTPSAPPVSQRAAVPSAPLPTTSLRAPPSAPSPSASEAPAASARPATAAFLVDEAVDVGPAGPATAHENGVVLLDKLGHLALAKRASTPTGNVAGKPTFVAIDRPRDEFASFGRGPAVATGFAYWIQHEKLVRARITGADAAPEAIASDARKGSRVVAVEAPDGDALVAFITKPDASGAPHAKLWHAGKLLDLTPEGAGASSVALVRVGSKVMAITLDGRSGMTPLHARLVNLEEKGALTLSPDVVAWVGASAQATTEVFATAVDAEVWAFVPIEQDLTHFGLAQIHLGREPRLDAPVTFLTYLAGTNSAPVAAAAACGRGAVAFAEPEDAAPRSPQRLMLASLGENGLEAGEVVARGRSFANVSLGTAGAGALLAYTADHRTWVRTLRCPDRARTHSELPRGGEKR